MVLQRVIQEHRLGIEYGEFMLRRLIAALGIDMVFDVGANVGQYGLQLLDRVGYRGSLISFEPLPQAANQLKLLTNKHSNWSIRQCALDDRNGHSNFNVMMGDQFSSLMNPSAEFQGRFHGQHSVKDVIEVEVITLEEAVRSTPLFSRGLLKLDTQGNELRILRSSGGALTSFLALQIEVGFQKLYQGQADFQETIDTAEQLGYRLSALFPNNEGHFPHLLEMDALFLRRDLLPPLA